VKNTLVVFSFLILISCNRGRPATFGKAPYSFSKESVHYKKQKDDFDTSRIICDSVYPNKGYWITLVAIDSETIEGLKPNTIFIFDKIANGNRVQIFRDSIYSRMREVRFEDFNGDKIKDIRVQNYSDVRSNLSYFLYLIDTANNSLKKIKGFEEIKEPRYIPKYNLIDNYVTSGRNWTNFYKIKSDSVFDFGILVQEPALNETSTYDRDYKRALNTILRKEKHYVK
jgi:hypothetical protein